MGRIEDDGLSASPRLRAGLLALKYVFRRGEQTGILELIGLSLRDAPEIRYPVMLYVVQTFESVDEAAIRGMARVASPKEEDMWASQFAQDIIAKAKPEWLQAGRQEGFREGEARTLLRQIERRFGAAPDWVHAKLDEADLDTLEGWTEKILDARSLEELFQ